MGIIDPHIIAFLKNYRKAQQGSDCELSEPVGSLLVDSMRRGSMLKRGHETAMAYA